MSSRVDAYFPSVRAFVDQHGGRRPIEKILIANNGIAAVKAIRSIRRWAYDVFGAERAIKFVAMATPEDLRANAEYIRMADEFAEVPGGSNVNNYANVSLIVELAKRYKVDAVLPGWGHASENPALPTSLLANDIIFMGPPAGPMFALGDKIGSTIIGQSCGVPVIPWSGDGLTCNYRVDGKIKDEVYSAACVRDLGECRAAIQRVGLPVMIKASEGGGGKGIRKVMTEDQIEASFRQVQSEVPGSPIFVMKVAFGARHLEVQLLADEYGNAVALNGRDCSVQRRHQKILEEGPPVAAPGEVWKEMERAAVRLAKEVGYINAGTVEYLFREEDNKFYFLELNPRLQVEHPVTEMITGVNLPASQLQVSMGIPLYRIADIRRFFGRDPAGVDPIDFDNTPAVHPDGHCIAARITAENPHKGFQPTSGKIHELNFRSSRHVWGYFSVDSSGLIHEFADSQLGHVFAWGVTREAARRNLVVALKDMSIRGEIRTTIEYLKDLLEVPEYKENKFHTAWLDERIAKMDVKDKAQLAPLTVVLIGAACEAHFKAVQREKTYLTSLERGQMPPLTLLDPKCSTELIYENTKYPLEVTRAGTALYSISLKPAAAASAANAEGQQQVVMAEVRSLADGGYLVLVGGTSHVAYVKDEVGARRLVVDSQTCLFVDEYDPTQVRAAMGGKIVRFLVQDGDSVRKDQPFVEIEVMKMNMPIVAPEDGVVTLLKTAGSVMEPGDVVAKLALADPTKVRRAVLFTGTLPDMGDPRPEALENNAHHILATARERLENVMTGFAPPKSFTRAALHNLSNTLLNPFVPALEIREALARVKREVPYALAEKLSARCDAFEDAMAKLLSPGEPSAFAVTSPTTSGDGKRAQALALASEFSADAAQIVKQSVDTGAGPCPALLAEVCARHAQGGHVFCLNVLSNLLDRYSAPEAAFAELEFSDSAEKDDVMQELRRRFASEPKKVYEIALSHAAVRDKNNVAVVLLGMVEAAVRKQEEISPKSPFGIRPGAVALLKKIASLRGKETTEVALEARQLLIELQSATYKERLEAIVERLNRMAKGDREARDELQLSTDPVLHYLIDIIDDTTTFSPQVRAAALESYVARVYSTYSVRRLTVADKGENLGLCASWAFYSEPDAISFVSSYHQPGVEMLGGTAGGGAAAGTGDHVSATGELPPGPFSRGGSIAAMGESTLKLVRVGSEGMDLAAKHVRTPSQSSTGNMSVPGATPGGAMGATAPQNRPRAGSGFGEDFASTTGGGGGGGGGGGAATSASLDLEDAGQLMAHAVPPFVLRRALLASFPNGLPDLSKGFSKLLQTIGEKIDLSPEDLAAFAKQHPSANLVPAEDVHVLHIILKLPEEDTLGGSSTGGSTAESLATAASDVTAARLNQFLREKSEELKRAGVRRVTFAVPAVQGARQAVVAGHGSSFYTFRRRKDWDEDRLVRHIEPALAFQLDLGRLSNFNIARVPLGKRDQASSRTVHVYRATPKHGGGGSRLFVRALVRQTSKMDGVAQADAYPGPERVLVQAIAALEALQSSASADSARNHIFLNVLGDALVEPHVVERMALHLGRRYAARLASARVGQVELKVNARIDKESPSIPVRVIASNPTGFSLRIDVYVEAADPLHPGRLMFYSISQGDDGGAAGALAAMGLSEPSTPLSSASSSINTGGWGGGSTSGGSTSLDPFADVVDHDLEGQSHSATAPELHGQDTRTPYPVSSPLEERRSRALASGTAFCYDLPALFHKALEKSWRQYVAEGRRGVDIPSPSTMAVFEELVLDDEIDALGMLPLGGTTGLAKTTRPSGTNSIAMVAWRAKLKTPQYPEGRELILIANDITVDAGSFGTREDQLFLLASKLARSQGLPRLYIAANSGARIGMADEVKRAFKVCWTDPTEPNKGFQFLYLDKDKYAELGPDGRNSVVCSQVADPHNPGHQVWRIDAIVGEGRDLGVENLRGSGLIAGETSRAYDETFTLTYVAGRSVGIGAYLVRLGQRTIQKGKDAPIILTGYQALNTLCGAPVYSSNLQLGGPGIMFANGVSHACVRNDLEGVAAMLKWLSYVPDRMRAQLPLTRLLREDPPDRDIAYCPDKATSASADPRLLLTGVTSPDGQRWVSGLFDKDSFVEYLGGWAKTIVTGRARLGGIPVGVIIPECRTVSTRVPADPASPDSQERVVTQAGNVWYPDSSYKTACAIRDINREGLPLVFLINVRGFSGGQRDMYDAVLKYGSMIVDALVEFKQPVIVYIPPHSELRGGAWVVVDPTINEDVMEMHVDDTARGGVLEAAGAASIKFRGADQIAVAHRLDPALKELDEKLQALVQQKGNLDAEGLAQKKKLQEAIKKREVAISQLYKQLATEFADAHDRPGRMVAKGVVRDVVPWAQARRFFFHRLRRLLREFQMAHRVMQARMDEAAGALKAARKTLKDIYEESGAALSEGPWDQPGNDVRVLAWMDSVDGAAAVDVRVRAERAHRVAARVEELGNQDPSAMLRGLMNLISRMSDEGRLAEREKLVSTLRRGVFILSSSTMGRVNDVASTPGVPPTPTSASPTGVPDSPSKTATTEGGGVKRGRGD